MLKERVQALEELLPIAEPELIEQGIRSKVFEEGAAVYAEIDLGQA